MLIRFKLLAAGCLGAAAVFFGAIGAANAGEPPHVKRYIDLNHVASSGMQTYPGLSLVEFSDYEPRFANTALIDEVTMLGITSTYIDAPYHIDPLGAKIADYSLEKLANLPVVVITKPDTRLDFEIEDFRGKDVRGKAVLLFSGHDQFWNTPQYGVDVPYLALDAAKWLVDHGAALVGIDSPLIDNFADNPGCVVHHELLENGVVIAEDMTNIGAVPQRGAYLTAVPPRVPMTSFMTRIFVSIYDSDD
jgi:kynurenine formamidase